jgi:hypothetical protein
VGRLERSPILTSWVTAKETLQPPLLFLWTERPERSLLTTKQINDKSKRQQIALKSTPKFSFRPLHRIVGLLVAYEKNRS